MHWLPQFSGRSLSSCLWGLEKTRAPAVKSPSAYSSFFSFEIETNYTGKILLFPPLSHQRWQWGLTARAVCLSQFLTIKHHVTLVGLLHPQSRGAFWMQFPFKAGH